MDDKRLAQLERIATFKEDFDGSPAEYLEMLRVCVEELKRFRGLRVYVHDEGWRGCSVVIASSEDQARKLSGHDVDDGPHSGDEIVDGWTHVNLGDS